MTTSYNGWPASENPKDIGVVPLVVGGVSFVGGVRGGDVHTVLEYIAQEFHDTVEPLQSPGCWGWAFRFNRNADNISCHGSATAIDCNAPKHPNGVAVARTFTPSQIRAVHALLDSIPELGDVVHWGGDWTTTNGLTPDSMHFELHNHDLTKLRRVAKRIKARRKDTAVLALLRDLTAVCVAHKATRVYGARVLLFGAWRASKAARRAKLADARDDLKGMDDPR